jgi:AcrR family transcriptional regulator
MKGSKTKERLLRIGLDRMSVQGLSGVTLGELASAAGLSKSGLFAHFRSKEQLQVDLLKETAQTANRLVTEPIMRTAKGLPRLSAVMDLWLGWPRRAGLSGGCPVAAALFEFDDVEGELRSHALKLEEHWREQLRQFVREAVAEGHLNTDTDVEQFVWELCGIYLSHHVSSRFIREEGADVYARKAFNALVQRNQATPVPMQHRPEA